MITEGYYSLIFGSGQYFSSIQNCKFKLRLKSECDELKIQVTSLIKDNQVMQEKYRLMLEKMQQDLRRKQLFIEELKNKVILKKQIEC